MEEISHKINGASVSFLCSRRLSSRAPITFVFAGHIKFTLASSISCKTHTLLLLYALCFPHFLHVSFNVFH